LFIPIKGVKNTTIPLTSKVAPLAMAIDEEFMWGEKKRPLMASVAELSVVGPL
jgi:hypothetical protein